MIEQVGETAKTISEVGIMETISAAFLVIALAIIGVLIAYFKKIVDALVTEIKQMMKDLLSETRKQNDMLYDISDALRPELKERIKVVANAFFDLAVFRAFGFIKRMKKENHLDQREEAKEKIRAWVTNLHSDRSTKFDNWQFRGKNISEYQNPDWIEKVSAVIEKEVYDSEPNEDRAFTNLKNMYDKIKIDYYNRLIKQ